MRLMFGTCSGHGPASCSYGTSPASARDDVAGIACAIGAGIAPFSPYGRCLVVLLAVVFYPVAFYLSWVAGVVPHMSGSRMIFAVLYLPPVLAAGAIIVAARRHGAVPTPRRECSLVTAMEGTGSALSARPRLHGREAALELSFNARS